MNLSKLGSYRPNNVGKLALIFFFTNLYFYLPVLTLYYQQRGLNFLQINSLQGIMIATIFLTNIPTGIFADKYGRKKAMIIALFLQLMGEIFFLYAYGYLAFVFICIIAGLGFSFMTGTVTALIYETLKTEKKENEMQKAIGTKSAAAMAAGIIAPFLVSFYVTNLVMDKFIILVILTIFSIAVGLIISFFLEEPIHSETTVKKASTLKTLKESLGMLKNNSNLQRIVLLSVLSNPLTAYFFILYQPYFVKSHVPSFLFGVYLSISSLIWLIATKNAYKLEQRFGVGKTVLMITVLPGLFYIAMGIVGNPFLAPLLFCLAYLPIGTHEPLFSDYQNRHIFSENRATLLSAIDMFNNIYIIFMGLIIGYLADKNLTFAFIFMGAVIVIGSSMFRINAAHLQNKAET